MMAHIYYPSYSGSRGRRIVKFETSLSKVEDPISKTKLK
jgi:hypothetical protein